jgi:hypothetical protein
VCLRTHFIVIMCVCIHPVSHNLPLPDINTRTYLSTTSNSYICMYSNHSRQSIKASTHHPSAADYKSWPASPAPAVRLSSRSNPTTACITPISPSHNHAACTNQFTTPISYYPCMLNHIRHHSSWSTIRHASVSLFMYARVRHRIPQTTLIAS